MDDFKAYGLGTDFKNYLVEENLKGTKTNLKLFIFLIKFRFNLLVIKFIM